MSADDQDDDDDDDDDEDEEDNESGERERERERKGERPSVLSRFCLFLSEASLVNDTDIE